MLIWVGEKLAKNKKKRKKVIKYLQFFSLHFFFNTVAEY